MRSYSHRIAVVFAIAALACLGVQSPDASAQEWPTKPIHIIVGFGAGGGTDIVTRIVAQPLSEFLGQPVVVENKPGAGGTTAGNIVAKSPNDGYTAVMLSAGHTVSAVMFKSLPYDSIKDFEPVALVANSAFVIVANKDFAANDIKGVVTAAKASPGRLTFASVGLGSTQHFAGELFKQRSGIDVKHIPYRNTPAVIGALRSKEVDYAVELAHAVSGQVRAGDLKLLAVATAERWPAIPDVPTMTEAGVTDYQVLGWYGLAFPARTPAAIVAKMNGALKDVLSREAVRKQIADAGALANVSSPQQFGKLIQDEIAKWRDVMVKANIEPQ
jgi:tripartite-type tricarboxylate transporter receptor subunit TctC